MTWRRDLDKDISSTISLAPAARTASANGTGVDLQNFMAAAVIYICGIRTDGTHTPTLEESDDNSSYSAVAAADMNGTLVAMTSTTTQEVGYKGTKRYIRAVITAAGTTTGALTQAQIIRAGARNLPQ